MTNSFRIGVAGCAGRMGQMLVRAIATTEGCAIAGGTEAPGGAGIGKDLGEIAGIGAKGIRIGDDPAALFAVSDAVLDFTAPAATMKHIALAKARNVVHVIGTTGLSSEQESTLRDAAKTTRIVYAGNMSLGVTLLAAVTERVASILGPKDWDVEIVEMHHNKKVDAPSGTALLLGAAAAKGRGVDLAKVSDRVRDGHTGARQAGHIGFAALRGGNVTGDHTVIFAGENERIELTHRSSSREIYARGAVRAALWARDQPAGIYSMRDVLGL